MYFLKEFKNKIIKHFAKKKSFSVFRGLICETPEHTKTYHNMHFDTQLLKKYSVHISGYIPAGTQDCRMFPKKNM